MYFGTKLYKLRCISGCTYDMDVYSGKDRTCVTTDVTATSGVLKQLTVKAEGHGCKLNMGNLVLSPDLFSSLTKKKFSCCRAVRPNRKECHRAVLAISLLAYS